MQCSLRSSNTLALRYGLTKYTALVQMSLIVRMRRLTATCGVLLMTARQSGNSYGANAYAVVVGSRLSVNFGPRAHTRRRFTTVDAKPEVDYSRLVPVIREGGKKVSYNAVWLRDNCRCNACFLSTTSQRLVVYHQLPPEAFVANDVTWVSQEGAIEVTWGDGHLSR